MDYKLRKIKLLSEYECSLKVESLRSVFTDRDLSEKLGITRQTLYTRIKEHNWKKPERALITIL